MNKSLRLLFLVAISMFFPPVTTFAQTGGDRISGAAFATRSPVVAQHGIAATSQPLATQIALDILKAGGTAVDAAIAANAAIGLMEPTGNGIGGDLFAIVWDPDSGQLSGLNGSGRSPMGLSIETLREELGESELIPSFGPLPVSVPGTVDAWFTLHERFGKLPMAEILEPAIRYAREGFPVSQVIAYYWKMNVERYAENASDIPEFDNFRKTFLIDGAPPEEGSIFKNPALAATLERIAIGGRDAFYQGELAGVMDAYMQRIGGYLRKDDLERHYSEWVEPVSVNYRGYDVFELPPNGQGIAALQMLQILEGFDLKSFGHNSAKYLHLQIEAKKLAFADRARYYTDPQFSSIPVAELISDEYAAARRTEIDLNSASQSVDPGNPFHDEGDTIYLTVADGNGMMVSLIQSNYVGMGSGLVPDGLGFNFQNRGALFAMDEHHANVYAPGKRPFHTIIPAFVMKDGQPFLSFGVMGGAMQPQGHVQILCNMIDFGMNVQEAGDAARYNHSGSSQPTGTIMSDGGTVSLENGIEATVRDQLRQWGHTVGPSNGSFGGYQAIMWDPVKKVYFGASEMRKDGQAAGY